MSTDMTSNEGASSSNKKISKKTKPSTQVEVVDTFSQFMALIYQKNMRPSLLAHAPACGCTKVQKLQQTIFDNSGILTVADSKRPNFGFRFPESATEEFLNNQLHCEKKLAKEIFLPQHDHNVVGYVGLKLRCSACLLATIPNATVIIVGNSIEIESVLFQARQHADKIRDRNNNVDDYGNGNDEKSAAVTNKDDNAAADSDVNEKLHHDHAHLLIALPIQAITDMCSAKTRSAKLRADDNLHQAMSNSSNNKNIKRKDNPIQLQHHLTTVFSKHNFFKSLQLQNISSKEKEDQNVTHNETVSNDGEIPVSTVKLEFLNSSTLSNPTDQNDDNLVIVLAYEDEDNWSLDLPGGKRHLGETCWDCARRETFEESSLVIDKTGITSPSTCSIQQPLEITCGGEIESDIQPNESNLLFAPVERVINCGMAYYLLIPPPTTYDNRTAIGIVDEGLSLLTLS